MARTINDLYLKYVNKVGRTLESDRYFQYLFEMVQAGENVLQQKNQILHKVVDEQWLTTIEDSLDAIYAIIEKPRRFVATTEELVPVALAKKITALSVRHLSQNTQFIASSENGDIQPTHVLNVTTEDSYDLYENRFIYHLIQRLVTFIDKRTDVIFWATGDEKQSVLSYESKVDDAYEQIEYRIEMTIKNKQSFAENDSDNMQLFMRIDRVRRMVMALKTSAFCEIMAGCSKVRSPIQRTNLLMKDPQYRTCYKLWQFLENYDDIGYSIEAQDYSMEFDEEYLIQMYTNFITNYTVFKSLMEDDKRDTEAATKRRRVIKPKFIKRIEEIEVEDRNIEDVEIRQVFVDEVTQAQLDAEAALEAEKEARKQAEEALEDMDNQVVSLQQRVSQLTISEQQASMLLAKETEEKETAQAQVAEANKELINARQEMERARTAEAEMKKKCDEDILAIKFETEAIVEAAKAEAENFKATEASKNEAAMAALRAQTDEELARTRKDADESVANMQKKTDLAIKIAAEEAESAIAAAREDADKQIATAREEADTAVACARSEAEEKIANITAQVNEDAAARIEDIQNAANNEIRAMKKAAEKEIADNKENNAKAMAAAKRTAEREFAEAQRAANALLAETKSTLENEIAETKTSSTKQIRKLEAELAKQQAELERLLAKLAETEAERDSAKEEAAAANERTELEKQAREKAEARADANRLGKVIATALNERRKKNTDGKEE